MAAASAPGAAHTLGERFDLIVQGAGEMIIALFAVMGITKIARIIPRK